MKKVVINRCFGGFSLSDEAIELYGKFASLNLVKKDTHEIYGSSYYVDGIEDDEHFFTARSISDRSDPALVKVVEHLKDRANGFSSDLKVVQIPDDVDWYIHEYDGIEWVAEKHRTWM